MTSPRSPHPSDPAPVFSPGFSRGDRVSDLVTREHLAFIQSGIAAERAGDAATALEYHQGVPMFRRSAHRVVLTQLADLSSEMTPWLWARWAAYQCTRAEDPDSRSQQVTRLALDYVLRMFHDRAMQQAWDRGDDPIPLMARTLGEDWAFHQICTYELGGLELFLDTLATGRLATGCALARQWVGARVGGYRLEPSSEPGRLVVRDLADDRRVELLDLGARVHVDLDGVEGLDGVDGVDGVDGAADGGGWLVGRLVPTGTAPGLMFDTRPLPVDEQTAVEASTGDRRGAWITALVRAIDDGRLDRSRLRSEDRELVTDVPSRRLLERGTPPAALASAREQLGRGRDEVGRAAYRILRAVADGSFGPDEDAAYVAAAVVNPHGFAEACRTLVAPSGRGQRERRQWGHGQWEYWARLVPEPARGRLARLAALSSEAAA